MKRIALLTAALSPILARMAFESGQPGWKQDEAGNVVLKDGNPVYVNAEGQESTVDVGTISRLNAEAKTHREARQKAEKDLKAFEGIDPQAAREAISTVGKLKDKELVDGGEAQRLRDEITTQYTGQINTLTSERDEARNNLNGLRLDAAFGASKWIGENIAIPGDLFRRSFADRFKVDENGNVVGLDKDGNVLASRKKMGEYADFDEAVEIVVGQYDHRDQILKAPANGGTGGGGNGGGRGMGKVMKRAEYDRLSPMDQATVARSMQIVD